MVVQLYLVYILRWLMVSSSVEIQTNLRWPSKALASLVERGEVALALALQLVDEESGSSAEPGARHHQVGVFMGQAAQLTCRGF